MTSYVSSCNPHVVVFGPQPICLKFVVHPFMSLTRNTSNFNSDGLAFESNPDQTGPLASEGEDAQAVVSGTNGGPEEGDLAADGANSGANGSEVRILAADSYREN